MTQNTEATTKKPVRLPCPICHGEPIVWQDGIVGGTISDRCPYCVDGYEYEEAADANRS